MDKYIIVTTLCDKEEIANKINRCITRKKISIWKSDFKSLF